MSSGTADERPRRLEATRQAREARAKDGSSHMLGGLGQTQEDAVIHPEAAPLPMRGSGIPSNDRRQHGGTPCTTTDLPLVSILFRAENARVRNAMRKGGAK